MNWTYVVYPSAVSPDYCNHLIDVAYKYQEVDAQIGGKTINTDIRSSKLRWIVPSQQTREVFAYLNTFVQRANLRSFGFDISTGNESFQYTEYKAEDKGHYSWHMDSFMDKGPAATDRKLSMVVQLSDPSEYEGGTFCIDKYVQPPFNLATFAPRGSIIVFPSYIKHCVTPVTKGVRKSLVSWYYGPSFR